MSIPKLHYISEGNTPEEHLQNIQNACTSGAELVQLCLKDVSEEKVLEIAEAAKEITAHFQTRLLINGFYKIAKSIKADGIHLDTTTTCPSIIREHLYTWQIIGATANTIQECETLLEKEVDYISLAPFTSNKEDNNNILGINGFNTILDTLKTATPIIGYGGITIQDVAAILETGISGIGISEAITKNFDSIKTFNQLLSASSTDELRHTFE